MANEMRAVVCTLSIALLLPFVYCSDISNQFHGILTHPLKHETNKELRIESPKHLVRNVQSLKRLRNTSSNVQHIAKLQNVKSIPSEMSLFASTYGAITDSGDTSITDNFPDDLLSGQNNYNLLMHQFASTLHSQIENQFVCLTTSPVLNPQDSLHTFPYNVQKIAIKKGISHDTVTSFKNLPWPTTLVQLRMIDIGMTSKTLKTIKYLPETLTLLNVANNEIDSLNGFEIPTGLEVLHLSNNQITSRNLQNTDLSSLTRLSHLYLGGNKINSLRDIKWPPNLMYLHLGHNEIDSCGLMGMDLPQTITLLDLRYNKITSFSGIRLPPQLQILSLDGNWITDQELYRLINFYLPSTIKYLNVCRNNICSLKKVKATKLDKIRGLLHLKTGNTFQRGHVRNFKKRHPNIKVF